MTEPLLVHVIDDDEGVRDSLGILLESAGFAVRTHASASSFLASASERGEGCVVTDVRMPEMDGLELQRRLAALGNPMPVVVMTGHADVPIAVEAMKAGAVDFLEKPFGDEQLLAAVRSALALSQRAHQEQEAIAATEARRASLTPRELEVLDQLVLGKPNKVIAYDLGASPRTIEVHRARVMEKMGARSLPELVRMTLALGRVPSARSR